MFKAPRISLSALLLTAFLGSPVQASLITDQINSELLTEFAGTWPDTTAIVGPGVEFSRTFPLFVASPFPSVELDVFADSFTFTFTNPTNQDCPSLCLFNLGLFGFNLSGLDWVDNPAGNIFDVVQTFNSFPTGTITNVSFGTNNISVDIDNPVIPGFGTVYSASWDIIHVVPLPAALPLFLSALAGLGLMGWRRRQADA